MKKCAPVFLIGTLLLAGCGTTSGLGTAADRLDSSAHRFYDSVYTDRGPAHAADDARALAEATRDFNRAVDGSRSRDELQPSFDRVAERYHDLRQQVADRDTRYAGAGVAFDRVTEAYLDAERAMNYPGSGARN
jgi:hypothetical protein